MQKSKVTTPTVVELHYTLAELPSSQHRAGLVGLILLIRELENMQNGIIQYESLSESSVTIKLDEIGLAELLNEAYASSEELQAREKPFKDTQPVKVEEKQEIDPRTNKTKKKTLYFYPVIVPRGSFLDREDVSEKKVWIKLWREMIWNIMRAVPATRKPFEDRAKDKTPSDIKSLWKQLSQDSERSVELPSTYFIGAQANNAEGVSFKDKGRFQFLLHFWPYVAHTYVPQKIDREEKRKFEGYCIAVPDVNKLSDFCDEFKDVLKGRGSERAGFRPRDAIIEIPEEAGLDLFFRISQVLSDKQARTKTSDLVLGVDIFHTSREGNNVRLLYSGRVEPQKDRDDQYSRIRRVLRDSIFRRQWLTNLVRERPFHAGFDKLFSEYPIAQTLCSPFFAQDARTAFDIAQQKHEEKLRMTTKQIQDQETVCLESLILKIIGEFLRRRMKDKYQLEWKKLQSDKEREEFGKKKEALGKDCFYAIRSRAGEDFINYFASTICSVPHWMTEEEYLRISSALFNSEELERVRTLSMLALSARISRFENKENEDNG